MKENNNFLFVEEQGEGELVLFLHGFLESNFMWRNILPFFENHKVFAIEMFGHGKSKFDPAIVPSSNFLVDLISEKIKKIPKSSISIVGHSLGGYIALELLQKFPEINKCVLLNSHPWGDSDLKKKDRIRVAQFVQDKKSLFINEAIPALFFKPNEISKSYISQASEMSCEAIAWHTLMMRDRLNLTQFAQKFNHKITIIQGEKDTLILHEPMKVFCEEAKIPFYSLENTGHMAHEESLIELINVFSKIFNFNAKHD